MVYQQYQHDITARRTRNYQMAKLRQQEQPIRERVLRFIELCPATYESGNDVADACEIARCLKQPRSIVQRNLNRLEREGLVARRSFENHTVYVGVE